MRIQFIKSYIHIFNTHRTTSARLISKTCASRTSQNTLENTWRWSTLSRAPCGRKRSRPDPSRAPASPRLSSPLPLRRLPWLCSGARAAVRCCARIPRKVLCDLAGANPQRRGGSSGTLRCPTLQSVAARTLPRALEWPWQPPAEEPASLLRPMPRKSPIMYHVASHTHTAL